MSKRSGVICCIVTSKNINTCKISSNDRRAGYILDMHRKLLEVVATLCFDIILLFSLLAGFFLRGELLAGINYFFFLQFSFQGIIFGNCHPPPPRDF